MRTLLTGGTGFIGSAVLDVLVAAGHDVVAAVRSDAAAADVTARGATAVHLDLFDADAVESALADVDAAIHAAAPDRGAADLDGAVVDGVLRAFAERGRFVLTSGIWVHGSGDDLVEGDPLDPADLVAWRATLEERVRASSVDARIIRPGVVYGRGRGLVPMLLDGPRTDDGLIPLIGDGRQRWSLVHVDDLARLYLAVLEHTGPIPRVIAVDGVPTSVRAIAERIGGRMVAPESSEATRARLGDAFAGALLLDQAATGAFARSLGWEPEHRSILDELDAVRSAA
ncbi:NAD-dependent epimerase/dehydratase family protein [Agromyces binzhouensis]|uniref:NAD-dependent epimerase/dehydratase family protein n=1 Tax=Agromyces binzhouensis TaxID=1817495 RepID=A0A4Q2JEE0_9MICO|nr:NAD-dependent epimerase/dehydratase family protein [Agromyces binzhouensis]RXZ44696.1 NAD-dependent epimerase/dehydratase family protein [Agromyces binzhouensis]